MTTTDAEPSPHLRLEEIAALLGMSYNTLAQRMTRSRAMGLPPPEPQLDMGRGQPKLWSNDEAARGEWRRWNRDYDAIKQAIQSHPHRVSYSHEKLRALWRAGRLEHWLQDFASVIAELIRHRDAAAQHVRIPARTPTGRLQAIDPEIEVITRGYTNNLRAWARVYAQRIRAADNVMRAWPEAATDWDKLLRRHLGSDWEGVLNRCARWRPRTR